MRVPPSLKYLGPIFSIRHLANVVGCIPSIWAAPRELTNLGGVDGIDSVVLGLGVGLLPRRLWAGKLEDTAIKKPPCWVVKCVA